MNIFYLDDSPRVAASLQCDKHVVKMILESAQMLCTAHRILDNNTSDILYRPTHKNHPSTIWARTAEDNYFWLYSHMIALGHEYTYRYGKVHATITKLATYLMSPPTSILKGSTPIPLVMPDEFKVINDPVTSYRNYYASKDIDMRWTNRDIPEWIKVTK